MRETDITIYGAAWCPDCRRSKGFLGEHQVPFRWIDVDEDPGGERFVLAANAGKRRIPTIVFADGAVLSVPSDAELARQLGLKTSAAKRRYHLVVIGGGPTGLAAALYASREGIETLVIERAALGGQAAATLQLDNVPGFPEGVSGWDFGRRLRAHAERFGAEMLQAQDVVALTSEAGRHRIHTADGEAYEADAVLLALGSRHRRLEVRGEEQYLGAGVHFCATCDGPIYRGRSVAVVGGGNSAGEESLFLAEIAASVTLLVRGDRLEASRVIRDRVLAHPRIAVRYGTIVEEFTGRRGKLETVHLRDLESGAREELAVPGAFVFVGLLPNTAFLRGSAVALDEHGFVLTGAGLATSVPGIFAAGDVRAGSIKQVATASGEGAAAALAIREHLGRRRGSRPEAVGDPVAEKVAGAVAGPIARPIARPIKAPRQPDASACCPA